jgi:hypothetical protein
MRRQTAVAQLEVTPSAKQTTDELTALRRRFARASSREQVEIDLLEDDLRQVSAALAGVNGYVARLERALGPGRMGGGPLAALALNGDPRDQVEQLSDLLGDVQRRLLRLAARG